MIYVSTACLSQHEPLSRRIEVFLEQGLCFIELGAKVSVDASVDIDFLKRVDADFLLHNYFPPPQEEFFLNLASANEDVVLKSKDLIRNALEWSSILQAPFYSVHAGFALDPIGVDGEKLEFPKYDGSSFKTEAERRFLDTLHTCLEHARNVGVQILIENNVCQPGMEEVLLGVDADDFKRLIGNQVCQDAGILLDTGHLSVSARTLGFDPLEFYSIHSDRVRAIHLHTNDGIDDQHRPYFGDTWIREILQDCVNAEKTIIIEAKFDDVVALRNYVQGLLMEFEK